MDVWRDNDQRQKSISITAIKNFLGGAKTNGPMLNPNVLRPSSRNSRVFLG